MSDRKKEVIKFNIWKYIDIEKVNELVDKVCKDKSYECVPSDIAYTCKSINDDGDVIIEADFDKSLKWV